MNEDDIHESGHAYSYWGPNYPRLLEVKRKFTCSPNLVIDIPLGWKGALDFPNILPCAHGSISTNRSFNLLVCTSRGIHVFPPYCRANA
ncbi:hypothetical protein B0H10DRAFT_957 [Mycena sp. CBHHK59/15]|nr:hypothetical protein B0H10DRAFT_957 [Mycena sp. CBHHK59/15]